MDEVLFHQAQTELCYLPKQNVVCKVHYCSIIYRNCCVALQLSIAATMIPLSRCERSAGRLLSPAAWSVPPPGQRVVGPHSAARHAAIYRTLHKRLAASRWEYQCVCH